MELLEIVVLVMKGKLATYTDRIHFGRSIECIGVAAQLGRAVYK